MFNYVKNISPCLHYVFQLTIKSNFKKKTTLTASHVLTTQISQQNLYELLQTDRR